MTPDWLLLRKYARENSQEAFAALTARYLGLVYAVCLREVHDPDLAQDVTQAVFLLLARTAPTFRSKSALPNWLFRTARFAAQNARTRETRRQHYEGKYQERAAQAMQQPPESEDAAWQEIEPLLNPALAALREAERQGVLLRFFQQMTFAEVGAALGLSEEAARKRVGRALEKLRRFFDREGVTLPSAVLPALLSAHALRPVPDHLAGAVTATLAGAIPAQVSLTTQGVLHSMKLVQLKLAAGAAALLIVGTTTYVLAQTRHAKPAAAPPVSLDAPINAEPSGLHSGGLKDAVRNVLLTGKIRYEDGRPAGGVEIVAQIQNKFMQDRTDAAMKRLGLTGPSHPYTFTKQEQEESGNYTFSAPDGTFSLPVGAGIPYNVMVSDTTGKWVAAAVEGASGAQDSTVTLPDLVLTHGAIITGTVSDAGGHPLSSVDVGSYGPHRPASSAAIISAKTSNLGNYRLRVAPGVSRVYIASGSGTTTSKDADKTVIVAAGEIQTVDLTQ